MSLFREISRDEDETTAKGVCELFECEIDYVFDDSVKIEEAERYARDVLNKLGTDVKEVLYKRLADYRDEMISDYDDDYEPICEWPDDWRDASGKAVLTGMKLQSVSIYKNPYDSDDPVLAASMYCDCAWDEENQMEILFLGGQLFDVTEFLGYGEFAFWEEESTWKDQITKLRNRMREYDEDLNAPCSEAELEKLKNVALEQLGIRVPQYYLEFLGQVNGFEFDGHILYGIDDNICERNENKHTGFIDNNKVWYENEAQKRYIFMGDSDISWYCYDTEGLMYVILDKPSGTLIKNFPLFDEFMSHILSEVTE